MNVRDILRQPEREWRAEAPATDADIALLESKTNTELPREYLELLRLYGSNSTL